MQVRTVLGVISLASSFAVAGEVPMAPVLDASFDAAYQDTRSQLSIQYDIYRFVADRTYFFEVGDPEDQGAIAACFAAGSNPTQAQIDAVNFAIQGFGSRYEIGGTRWGAGVNNPTTVNWSFVPDGVSIPGGAVGGEVTAPSILFSRMDTLFGAANRATWVSKFVQCFTRWGEVQGINYVRVQVGGNDWDNGAAWGTSGVPGQCGDVRIGMHNIDGGSNVLAYNAFPNTGTGGDMVIDSSETWSSASNDYRFLRNTVMHEHGHGIGLFHVCPIPPATGGNTKLMEPFLSTSFDGPQQDDIRGAQWYYGDINEPNNASGTATDLGAPPAGVAISLGNITSAPLNTASLSLASDTDQDWFKINLDIPRLVNIVATPIGSSYVTGPQTGPCNTGSTVNGLNAADIQIDALAANGSTVYYNGNTTAAGAVESVASLLLPQGNNYIRISDFGTTTTTQLYKLTITPRTDVVTPTASDLTFTDKVRVTWPIIASATDYQIYRNTSNSTAGATQVFAGLGNLFDDTTAVPGQTYYYYLRVEQFNNGSYRYTAASGNGEAGTRAVPANVPPTANAGPDQNLTDSDNSGTEPVTLNGSLSTDTDGTIVSYQWKEGIVSLAPPSASPTLNTSLSVGSHTITLAVVDNSGAPGTDTVVINIAAGGPVCDSIDFNNDGLFPDTTDIDDFLSVFSGGPCSNAPLCGDIDFNNDGLFPDTTDIDSLLSVFSGGPCF